jgi:hypothetical protein
MTMSKSAFPTQKCRLIASISLVSGALGVAYWLYKNKKYAEEKPDVREERFKLLDEFSEITNCITLNKIRLNFFKPCLGKIEHLNEKLKDYLEGTKIPSIDRIEFAQIMNKLHINDENIIEA